MSCANDHTGYIAIGIDFGTTHSAVSWACSLDADNIHQVTGWPSLDEQPKNESQIPTQIDLKTGGWGFLVPKDGTPIRWFRHLLLNPDDLGEDVRESAYLRKMRELLEMHENATGYGIDDVVADFFKAVWEHAVQDIERHLDVNKQQLRVAVTVPTAWPEYVRQRLLAAVKAGFLNHRLFSQTVVGLFDESDAAATYSLYESRLAPEVEVGETFIVCDCGGVTVDISGYVKSPRFSQVDVKRITPGGGKLCGGFLVDLNFDNWIKRKLSPARTADSNFQGLVKHKWEHTIKRTFNGRDTHQAPIVHISVDGHGSESHFEIPRDSVAQFFAKSYSGVRQLIKEHMNAVKLECGKPPKKVFLVGGLGASPYLYLELQSQFQVISQPLLAWSAVVTGAVVMLLSTRGGAIFDDIIKVEESSEQLSHNQYGLQHTTGHAACSMTELRMGDVRASTSENTALTSEETEQHDTSVSRPWAPLWQLSVGKLGIFRVLSPAPPSKQVKEGTATATFSYQIHQPETADIELGEGPTNLRERVDLGQSCRRPSGQQSRLSLALLGENQPSTINVTGNAQTSSSPLRHSLEGSTAVRHSATTDKTNNDRANSLNVLTSATPCPNTLCFKFQKYLIKEVFLLREQNEEQRQQIEDMVKQRERETEDQQRFWKNPRSYGDLQQEIAQLKVNIKSLEQEATERSKNMRYIMGENERLEAELAIQVREKERLGEQLRAKKGKNKIQNRQEGHDSLERDNNGRRNLPEQFGNSADQLKHIPNIQAFQPEKSAQRPSIENTTVILSGIKEVRLINGWDSLCWDIRRWSEFLVQDYFNFLRPPAGLTERCSTMNVPTPSLTTEKMTKKRGIKSSDQPTASDTRKCSDSSGNIWTADSRHDQNVEEWLKRILESETAISLTCFQEILEFLTTPSSEDWPTVRHRLSWLAEATIWSVLMDRRVLRTKNQTTLPNLPDAMEVYLRSTIGLVLGMETGYMADVHTELRGLASSAIRLGQELRQLSDLWYCEYPHSLSALNLEYPDDWSTWGIPVLTSALRGAPMEEQKEVKFDERTMGERGWCISPDIGPDVVVGLVIRPGLVNMVDPNNCVEAKCHVITLRSRPPTSMVRQTNGQA